MKRGRNEGRKISSSSADVLTSLEASTSHFIVRKRNLFEVLLFDLYAKCCGEQHDGHVLEEALPSPSSSTPALFPGLSHYDASCLAQLVRAVIDRSRTPDEYELTDTPLEVRHIHGNHIQLGWAGYCWSIDDFLGLLLATDELHMAMRNETFLIDSAHDQTLRLLQREQADPERFPHRLLHDPALGGRRDELKCFLLLYAFAYDTRIERLFCKWNNLHHDMTVDPLPTEKIQNVRAVLGPALESYIMGQCSRATFFANLVAAYQSGVPRSLQTRPLAALSETPTDYWSLFNPSSSVRSPTGDVTLEFVSGRDAVLTEKPPSQHDAMDLDTHD